MHSYACFVCFISCESTVTLVFIFIYLYLAKYSFLLLYKVPHYPLAYWLLFMDHWLCCIDPPPPSPLLGRVGGRRRALALKRGRIWWNDQAGSFVSPGKLVCPGRRWARHNAGGSGWSRLRRVSEITPGVLCNKGPDRQVPQSSDQSTGCKTRLP